GSRTGASDAASAAASASMLSSSSVGSTGGVGDSAGGGGGGGAPVSQRICQSTPSASLSASRITSALRGSVSRLASAAASWLRTRVLPSTASTVAPASI